MRLLIAAALLFGSVRAEAAAPPVQLALRDGMIWLVARDATLGQVFDEWARVGQTTVVNADQLSGRVSIELSGIPEGQALDVLLRNAGGFLAVQRVAAPGGGSASSQFARIVIMPVRNPAARTAPVNTNAAMPAPVYQAPPPNAVPVAPGVQRLIGPDGQPVPDDQEDAPAPRPGRRALPPGFATPPQTPPAAPPALPQSGPVGSSVPGMIVPAPGAATPAPQPPRRPSGID
jgi:hypothetical protein